MRHEQRNIAVVIVLCFITCGIYYLYWMYQVSGEIQDYVKEVPMSPAMEVLLTVITCGIYGIFWMYRYNQMLQRTIGNLPVFGGDNTLICVILTVLGLSPVSAGILQNQLNLIWENGGQTR